MVDQQTDEGGRQLYVPGDVPPDFAHAVATILLLGIAPKELWDRVYKYPPDKSIAWVGAILGANDVSGLVHSDIHWWEHQLRGH